MYLFKTFRGWDGNGFQTKTNAHAMPSKCALSPFLSISLPLNPFAIRRHHRTHASPLSLLFLYGHDEGNQDTNAVPGRPLIKEPQVNHSGKKKKHRLLFGALAFFSTEPFHLSSLWKRGKKSLAGKPGQQPCMLLMLFFICSHTLMVFQKTPFASASALDKRLELLIDLRPDNLPHLLPIVDNLRHPLLLVLQADEF